MWHHVRPQGSRIRNQDQLSVIRYQRASRAVGRRYYIVVSLGRNATSWVVIASALFFSGACAANALGQQPNRKPEPYVAPLLPAEAAWIITLPAPPPPTAGGAMDAQHVYVPIDNVTTVVEGERIVTPGSASVTALDRETGVVRWSTPIATAWAPVIGGTTLLVAAAGALQALNARTGVVEWSVPLDAPVRAPMLLRGNLLVALIDPDVLLGIRIDTHEVAWRRPIAETGAVRMNADERSVYVATAAGRLVSVQIADGAVAWERRLEGTLSEPAVGRDRVFVGSTTNRFWAIDPESGKDKWKWDGRIIGGDVIGAAVENDVVYVASLDNIVRAMNRGNGNQRWKKDIGTRPVLPPRAFFGTVVITGLAPTVSTLVGEKGTPVSTWSAPVDAELQGAPLIDENLKAFQVAMVIIMRDGRVTGLRPTAMLFREQLATPITVLPGRPLPRETLPGEPDPAASAPPAATPRR
jgi:outer membrane protein assembly factor BamB